MERREQAIAIWIGSTGSGRNPIVNGRRQPSCDGTSRMNREVHVRICERLGVKCPGPTRHSRPMHSIPVPINVRCYSNSDVIVRHTEVMLRANKRHQRVQDEGVCRPIQRLGGLKCATSASTASNFAGEC